MTEGRSSAPGFVAGDNVDPEEIRKFNAQAGEWWEIDQGFGPLHQINPARVAYIRQRMPPRGRKVLDVGCGGGLLSEALAREGAQVTGIDLGAEGLRVARAHAAQSGLTITYRQLAVETLARQVPGTFDGVVCMEMLEHVPAPDQVIQACGALARPGGDIFLATLNRNPLSFLLAIMAAEWILRLLPVGTHRYDRFIKPREIQDWARVAGLAVGDLTGLQYQPLLRRATLGGHLHVNYLAHLKRPA